MERLPYRFRSRSRVDASSSFPNVQDMMASLPSVPGNHPRHQPIVQNYSEAIPSHPHQYVRATSAYPSSQGMVQSPPGYPGRMPPPSGYPGRMPPPPGFAGVMPSPHSYRHLNPAQQNFPDRMRPIQSYQEPVSSKPGNPEMMLAVSSATNSPKFNFGNKALEVGRMVWPNCAEQHYLRGCKWSPDGECLLTTVHGEGMHIVEVPKDLYDARFMSNRQVQTLDPVISVPESGMIYDYSWYPAMRSADPATCFWAASGHQAPIHLWDAFTGERRCSFRAYNKMEELEAAVSVVFSADGKQLFGGFKKSIRMFLTDRPGKDCVEYNIKETASCLASSMNRGTIAIGSWRGTIELVAQNGSTLSHRCKFVGHKGGVTHMVFSQDERRLYSGARQDKEIICWDIRILRQPLFHLFRDSLTNQKIYFDLSKDGNWLITGGTNGKVSVWNVSQGKNSSTQMELNLHKDCCNGVSLHPNLPILATASGQFQVFDPVVDLTGDYENHLAMWWVGNLHDEVTDNTPE